MSCSARIALLHRRLSLQLLQTLVLLLLQSLALLLLRALPLPAALPEGCICHSLRHTAWHCLPGRDAPSVLSGTIACDCIHRSGRGRLAVSRAGCSKTGLMWWEYW